MQPSDLEARFTAFIEGKHLRKTAERFAILRKAETMHRHFDADQLHQALEQDGYHVSRSTVYNTVDLLCQCGILRRLTFDPHQAHYELAGRNHLHLVCTSCGAVREVEDEVLESRMAALRFPSFSSSLFSLTVYGLCSRCQRRINKEATGREKKDGSPSLSPQQNRKHNK